jgi:3-carboxy-cis,cis-muconate cycloisomerase
MIMQTPSPLLQALVGDEEVEAFFSDAAELAAMLRAEAALAQAGAGAGLIDREAARRIGEACRAFQPDWAGLAEGLARDGAVVPELVKQLRAAIGEPHGRSVHLGATSQDIVDTALVLRLKDVLAIVERRLDALIASFRGLQAQEGGAALMAHTRMQQALPFTAADKIETWVRPLERHRQGLRDLAPRLLAIQLGGPIGTRGELKGRGDAVAAAMAGILGLGSALPWHSQRDRIGELAAFLSLLSGTLGKFGQDIALMAQNEVGEVRLVGHAAQVQPRCGGGARGARPLQCGAARHPASGARARERKVRGGLDPGMARPAQDGGHDGRGIEQSSGARRRHELCSGKNPVSQASPMIAIVMPLPPQSGQAFRSRLPDPWQVGQMFSPVCSVPGASSSPGFLRSVSDIAPLLLGRTRRRAGGSLHRGLMPQPLEGG